MAYVNMMPNELAAKYTREKLWMQKTVFDILAERASAHPDRIAIKDHKGRHQLWRAEGQDRASRCNSIVRSESSGATSLRFSFPIASNSPSLSSRSSWSAPSPTRSIRIFVYASWTTC